LFYIVGYCKVGFGVLQVRGAEEQREKRSPFLQQQNGGGSGSSNEREALLGIPTPAKFEVEGGAPNLGDPWETAPMALAFRWRPARPPRFDLSPTFRCDSAVSNWSWRGLLPLAVVFLTSLGIESTLSLSSDPAQPFASDHYSHSRF